MPKGIKVAYFCKYLQEVDLKGSNTISVIVEIKHLSLDNEIISDKEKVNLEFSGIARIGRSYAMQSETMIAPEIP